jgi:hypothetical protein
MGIEAADNHGTYIDGFAAPQDEEHPEMWAAKLVLEMMPKWSWVADWHIRDETYALALRVP